MQLVVEGVDALVGWDYCFWMVWYFCSVIYEYIFGMIRRSWSWIDGV